VADRSAVYVISVAAELAGMHPQTLREYERKGLVSPRRSVGNSRRYSAGDVERLTEIQRLTRDEGLNLAGVRMVMELRDQLDDLRRRLAEAQLERRAFAEQLTKAVEDAHRSHRAELVPLPPRAVEVHPDRRVVGRPTGRR